MQEYRSGHNEAVLKTVCPKGTGVRIPLPAPNKRTTEPKKLGCFFISLTPVREDLKRPLWLSESQNGVRILGEAQASLDRAEPLEYTIPQPAPKNTNISVGVFLFFVLNLCAVTMGRQAKTINNYFCEAETAIYSFSSQSLSYFKRYFVIRKLFGVTQVFAIDFIQHFFGYYFFCATVYRSFTIL